MGHFQVRKLYQSFFQVGISSVSVSTSPLNSTKSPRFPSGKIPASLGVVHNHHPRLIEGWMFVPKSSRSGGNGTPCTGTSNIYRIFLPPELLTLIFIIFPMKKQWWWWKTLIKFRYATEKHTRWISKLGWPGWVWFSTRRIIAVKQLCYFKGSTAQHRKVETN